MAYIGVDPNIGDITFQTFTGTGSATAFTLAQSVVSGEALLVTIGNVVQEPGASKAYTAQGNTLTFSAAPANGDVITVRFFGRAVDQPTSYAMQLFKYVATNNQTAFTGADANGAILAFSGDDVDVYLNGVHLDSSDFTASNGDTITLGTGATTNDELVIRAYRAFTVTDTVSKASGGTFSGAVTVPQLNADNLRLDGNTISSTNTNGNVTIDPTGTGVTEINGKIEADNASNPALSGVTNRNTILQLQNTDTGYVAGNATAIDFGTSLTSATASIIGRNHNSGSGYGGDLILATSPTSGNSLTERVRVDSSGNVGIGTSPTAPLHVKAGNGTIKLHEGAAADNKYGMLEVSNGKLILHSDAANVENQSTMQFHLDNIEYARFKDNGQLAIGSDGSFRSSEKLTVKNSTDTSAMWCTSASGSVNMLSMYRGSGQTFVGSVETTGSATQYVSASDHRLKENVVDLTGAIDRLKTLSPRRFNFIAEPDTTLDGFIAHEVTACPEAVSGTHNAVDDDGNPKYQGLDASKLVPLLTGALQEAIAKIETLETQRADLETRLAALEAAE